MSPNIVLGVFSFASFLEEREHCKCGEVTVKTLSDGEEVVLAVRDPGEGEGIEPAVLKKLGTPFFTTKENGTGLGLSTCYSIATRHHAGIKIQTGSGGTTFFVRLGCNRC